MQLGRMVRSGMRMGVEGWLWVLVRSLGWLIVGAVTAYERLLEEVRAVSYTHLTLPTKRIV